MDMDKLVSLCKRRGFIFPSSEIYGGINGFWDYGPLGVELKRNIKDAWWRDVVQSRDDIVGLDCSIIMHPRIWEASGHVGGFNDPMVDCKATQQRYRADQLYVFGISAKNQPPTDFAFVSGVGRRLGDWADHWVSAVGASLADAWEAVRPRAAKLLRTKPDRLETPTLAATVLYMDVVPEDRARFSDPTPMSREP